MEPSPAGSAYEVAGRGFDSRARRVTPDGRAERKETTVIDFKAIERVLGNVTDEYLAVLEEHDGDLANGPALFAMAMEYAEAHTVSIDEAMRTVLDTLR
jgi:hypothetical protein